MVSYILRWYGGDTTLGEASVHRDSGLMSFTYEGMPIPVKPSAYNRNDYIFIPENKLPVISKAGGNNLNGALP